MLCLIAPSCPILCDPKECYQAPLSMGIFQAKILEWVVMPSSRGSSQPRDRTKVFPIAGGFFTDWAMGANPIGNQSWICTGRTDAEAEAPILWPPDAKNWLTGKDSDAGKDGRQEEKGTTEDETVGWHHWLNGHEFEQSPGVGDGQGGLVCCGPWGHKESDTPELNWTELTPWESPRILEW